MEDGLFAEALITVLIVVGVSQWMAFAADRRLTYFTTVHVHRSVAHGALKLRYPLMFAGDYTMNRVGTWVRGYVVTHREHHSNTDRPGDPHSPWNFVDVSIRDPDVRRRQAVDHIITNNLELYGDVAGDVERVKNYTGPIRTTFIDGWGKRLGHFTHLWYYGTHLAMYLLIGWTIDQLVGLLPGSFGLNPWVYGLLAFGLAIYSSIAGGQRYIRNSARVNAYGHAWPEASENLSVGHASDHRPTARATAGEGNQAWHHRHQMSARLRDPAITTWRDDKGFVLIRALQLLRLAYDVKVDDMPAPVRMLNDDLSVPDSFSA